MHYRPPPALRTLILLLAWAWLHGCGGEAASPLTTVHVDPSAVAGGDGSDSSPVRTIGEATAIATALAVVLAPGTYRETVAIGRAITLRGAGKGKSVLEPGADRVGIKVAAGGRLDIAGLTIKGGDRGIVVARGGKLVGADLRITGPLAQGLFADGAEVKLVDLEVDSIRGGLDGKTIARLGNPQGLWIKNSKLELARGTFTKTAQRALALEGDSSQANIASCRVSGATVAALAILGGQATITSCVISDSRQGVFVGSAAVRIEGTSVLMAGHNGIHASQPTSLTIHKCVITDPRESGVSVTGGQPVVTGTTVVGAGLYGIFLARVAAPGARVMGNTLRSCKGYGIVANLSTAQIEGNLVEGVLPSAINPDDANGIGAQDSVVQVLTNEIKGPHGAGVQLVRSRGVVGGNRISGSGDPGILVLSGTGEVEVRDNRVSGALVAGIMAMSSTLKMKGNQVTGTRYSTEQASGSGIVLFGSGSRASLNGDSSVENAQHGLMVVGAGSAEVVLSVLSRNKMYGVYAECAKGKVKLDSATLVEQNGQGARNTCP